MNTTMLTGIKKVLLGSVKWNTSMGHRGRPSGRNVCAGCDPKVRGKHATCFPTSVVWVKEWTYRHWMRYCSCIPGNLKSTSSRRLVVSMRKSPGKKRGYVVLPIGIPAGIPPERALEDNEKYRVIWQIVNALKSHDERLEAQINAATFGEGLPRDRIRITIGNLAETAPARLTSRSSTGDLESGDGERERPPVSRQQGLNLRDSIAQAIYARIVKRCGAVEYWEDWAADVQKIAQNHVTRIRSVIDDREQPHFREVFETFLAELRDDLNPSVTEDQAIEMLAQHLITRPVFDAVFAGHAFTSENSVSQAMQRIVDRLDVANIGKESADLTKFYASVRRRASEVSSAAGKQNLIKRLYESFFRKAFGKISEQLGIVYTPVEAVDYILHAVDRVMRDEFGFGLGQRDVKILDPFVGTGTFLVRALQSGLVRTEDLPYKYRHDLYANEIVPLAYYIAGINIENAYHALTGESEYEPFNNLCLTDTFQVSEHHGLLRDLFPLNQERIDRQRELNFLAIVGNPPYSAGQRSANDNAANVSHPTLDKRIEGTYAKGSAAQNKNSLYDSYIRAIRWASDRIGNKGVLGFITNGGWLDGAAMTGLRKCLREEFSSLYVLNLRGDARTSGELRRKEKDSVFGQGTRTPVAIAVLVKNPVKTKPGVIYYHDIGDYLNREAKTRKTCSVHIGGAGGPMGTYRTGPVRGLDPSAGSSVRQVHTRWRQEQGQFEQGLHGAFQRTEDQPRRMVLQLQSCRVGTERSTEPGVL